MTGSGATTGWRRALRRLTVSGSGVTTLGVDTHVSTMGLNDDLGAGGGVREEQLPRR